MKLARNSNASGLGLAAATMMTALLVAPGAVADPAPSAPAPAAAATVRILGPGSQPGLAVDAAGTAYVAWNGPENPSTLRFCKIPRGGTACAPGLTTQLSTLGYNSLTRPFVFVSGSRVIIASYRYPQSGTEDFRGTHLYLSSNGGQSFAHVGRIGTVPFFEMVAGPGNTLSGVTDALSTGMVFQNIPADGSAGGTAAVLSSPDDSPYRGGVGLLDAATPLAVFTAGNDAAKVRRYDGSGSLNNAANWLPAVGIGHAAYPKLAGGPSGLWLVAGDAAGRMFVRKYNGSGFGAALSLGPGIAPNQHLFQDAAGRLHSVVQRGDASGLHLIHWVSDVDGEWRSETLASQNPGGAGAFNSPRVAIAPDHIGFAVWQASSAGDIRIVPVDADVPRPKPGMSLSGRAKHKASKVVVTTRGRLAPPTGVAPANACTGDVKVTIKKGAKVLASKTDALGSDCSYSVRKRLGEGKVGDARKLKLVARFSGNRALAPTTTSRKVRVRG